MQITFYMQIAF